MSAALLGTFAAPSCVNAWWYRGMAWIVPKYSNSLIDKAGAFMTKPKSWMEPIDFENALEIVENYRASHSFPLLVFRMGLTHRSKKIDSEAIVAQRLKRLSSVDYKLQRFPTMRLSHMQDIGGCRTVVRSVRMVRRIVTSFKNSDIKHKLLRTVDYIKQPRDSGYRGIQWHPFGL